MVFGYQMKSICVFLVDKSYINKFYIVAIKLGSLLSLHDDKNIISHLFDWGDQNIVLVDKMGLIACDI